MPVGLSGPFPGADLPRVCATRGGAVGDGLAGGGVLSPLAIIMQLSHLATLPASKASISTAERVQCALLAGTPPVNKAERDVISGFTRVPNSGEFASAMKSGGWQTEGDAQQSLDYRRLDADETDGQSARAEWPIIHQE